LPFKKTISHGGCWKTWHGMEGEAGGRLGERGKTVGGKGAQRSPFHQQSQWGDTRTMMTTMAHPKI
jgi:hypothetical protein